MIEQIDPIWFMATIVQSPGADSVIQWFDSGMGIMALLLIVGLHTIMTARWAGRVETQLDSLRHEIPGLRQAKHDTANLLSSHEARLNEAESRMGSHSESIHRMRERVENVTRLDDRLDHIDQRLGRIEDYISRNRQGGG